ncbi:MAG TPA: flagellar basal body rod protein FlgB [Methylomirabilota bacterium]|nr:flagellar basal body rod protein FlgB [Methylomirabilota bacterium]
MNLFGPTVELLRDAVQFASRRHEVLARNLANVETPGYRAQDVVFQRELESALRGRMTPVSTLPPPAPSGNDAIQPVLVYSSDTQRRVDGNDVDLDKQMVRVSQNTVYHNALVQILTTQFNVIKLAISGRV